MNGPFPLCPRLSPTRTPTPAPHHRCARTRALKMHHSVMWGSVASGAIPMFELGSRQTALTDDREQCAGAQLSVIGYRDGDRTLGACLLHHDMASAASHFHETVSRASRSCGDDNTLRRHSHRNRVSGPHGRLLMLFIDGAHIFEDERSSMRSGCAVMPIAPTAPSAAPPACACRPAAADPRPRRAEGPVGNLHRNARRAGRALYRRPPPEPRRP